LGFILKQEPAEDWENEIRCDSLLDDFDGFQGSKLDEVVKIVQIVSNIGFIAV
jgi:hypothetical protein